MEAMHMMKSFWWAVRVLASQRNNWGGGLLGHDARYHPKFVRRNHHSNCNSFLVRRDTLRTIKMNR